MRGLVAAMAVVLIATGCGRDERVTSEDVPAITAEQAGRYGLEGSERVLLELRAPAENTPLKVDGRFREVGDYYVVLRCTGEGQPTIQVLSNSSGKNSGGSYTFGCGDNRQPELVEADASGRDVNVTVFTNRARGWSALFYLKDKNAS